MPLFTRTPTIYDIDPHAFLVQDLANSTLQTTGTQTLQLIAIRKGTCVIDCWVDVDTASGASGTCSINTQVAGGGAVISVMTFDGNSTGFTRGPITATGYDSITADGFLQLTKVGLGTDLVLSAYALMVRPNMNP